MLIEVFLTEGRYTMNVFDLRNRIVSQYSDYIQSYISISDERIRQVVEGELESGLLWPEPLVQLSPSFAPGASIDDLVNEGILHPSCRMIFRARKTETHLEGYPLRLHKHQEEAVRMAADGYSYVLTTGTGSGKSLAYIIPIVNDILRSQSGQGIRAIVVYPMNALANSQLGELRKFLCQGFPEGQSPVRFERYTGEETDEDKRRIMANPPDILLTNYVMLEYILTRPSERTTLVQAAQGLRFLVLDELHTYRGRQGGDVALLVRRLRNLLKTQNLQCVGTSATIASGENIKEQKRQVSQVALRLFGVAVPPERVIGETLRRITPEREIEHTDFLSEMKSAFTKDPWSPPLAYEEFIKHPFSSWIESTLGVNKEDTGHLVRATPRRIAGPDGIGSALATQTGLPLELCTQAITKWLLVGFGLVDPETGGGTCQPL